MARTTKVRVRPNFIGPPPGLCHDPDKHEGLRTSMADMKQHMTDVHGFIYEEVEGPSANWFVEGPSDGFMNDDGSYGHEPDKGSVDQVAQRYIEVCAKNERLRDALALIVHHPQPSSSEMRRIARDALDRDG